MNEVKNELINGMVIYSDGGSRGNGFSGWGLHGYIYTENETSKGNGNHTNTLTKNGYVVKKNKSTSDDEVKAISYIDGFGSIQSPATNNVAELHGAINGLDIADKNNVKYVNIITDSKYVIDGATDWLPGWKKRDFKRDDGSIISNKSDWLYLDSVLTKLKDKGVDVSFNWIKGHSGNIGNELADKCATIAVFYSKDGVIRSEVDKSPAQGYWSTKSDRHPLLNNKKAYFSTRPDANIPGEYYLGDHGTDDDLLGKKQTDGSICYLELTTPDPLIEMVKEKQINEAKNVDIIVILMLDKLFSSFVTNDLFKYGGVCLFKPNPRKIDLVYLDKEPITRGMVPPKLAMRVVYGINELKGIYLEWLNKNPLFIETDITDKLYELDKKNNIKFRSDITSDINKLNIDVSYGENKVDNISIYFGNSLPDKNALKKIDNLNPKVYVITWMESQKTFKYAVIIKTDNSSGIWSSFCSNLKFISS